MKIKNWIYDNEINGNFEEMNFMIYANRYAQEKELQEHYTLFLREKLKLEHLQAKQKAGATESNGSCIHYVIKQKLDDVAHLARLVERLQQGMK